MREGKKARKARQKEILKRLAEHYPDARPALHYGTPFELLIAVILSAQCTDVRVNQVTDKLFPDYDTPEKMLTLSQPELEKKVHSCGLGESKSKNILATCRMILEDFGGEIPRSIEELQKLPGVGKKTANVVGSVAFDIPAIAVDTHVFRVSNRLGLAEANTVQKTEAQLMEAIPREDWSKAHHWLIFHGRRICAARKPKCPECFLTDLCPYYIDGQRAAVKAETKK